MANYHWPLHPGYSALPGRRPPLQNNAIITYSPGHVYPENMSRASVPGLAYPRKFTRPTALGPARTDHITREGPPQKLCPGKCTRAP